jgi:hypothetical protein
MVVHNLIRQLVISCSDMLRARLIIFGLDYLRAGVSYVVYNNVVLYSNLPTFRGFVQKVYTNLITEHLLDSA